MIVLCWFLASLAVAFLIAALHLSHRLTEAQYEILGLRHQLAELLQEDAGCVEGEDCPHPEHW